MLSLSRRSDPPRSIVTAPWIGAVKLHLGRDVSHIRFGDRRIEVPEHRRLIAAWSCPQSKRGVRPLIVAFGPDGTELSRIGPHEALDTRTWERLRDEGGVAGCRGRRGVSVWSRGG